MAQKTFGQMLSEAYSKTPDTDSPIELQREFQKGVMDQISECAQRGKKLFKGNFFVEMLTKAETVGLDYLTNLETGQAAAPRAYRFYYIPKSACPYPDYDQSVWKVHRNTDTLEYLWSIPDMETCQMYLDNILEVDEEEKELLHMIIDFRDGTLRKRARELTGENVNGADVKLKVEEKS